MKFCTLILFLLISLTLFAQPKQNSPYSRFGLGDPFPQYFAQHGAMGGLTTANHDDHHLNMLNPASFAFLRSTAFETGLYAKNSSYKSSTSDFKTWSGNLTHLALGFTLRNPINEALDRNQTPWQVGMGIAVNPVNLVGYSISTEQLLPNLGRVNTNFAGKGGNYQFQWGTGVKYKKTAIGAQLGWVFGKSTFETTTRFPDTLPTFQNNFRDEIRATGFKIQLGAMHDFHLKYDPNNKKNPTQWITVGATFVTPHQLNGSATILRLRSRGEQLNGVFAAADTIFYAPDLSTRIKVPGTLSFGLTFTKANKLKIGAQADFAAWKNFEHSQRPHPMRNTFNVSAGVEIIPDIISYNKYWRRVRYRFGTYLRQDPRLIDGKNINDMGMSVGVGLPLILPRQGTSFINLSAEIGKSGAATAISETYARLTVGFTLNDNSWFFKRRFE